MRSWTFTKGTMGNAEKDIDKLFSRTVISSIYMDDITRKTS